MDHFRKFWKGTSLMFRTITMYNFFERAVWETVKSSALIENMTVNDNIFSFSGMGRATIPEEKLTVSLKLLDTILYLLIEKLIGKQLTDKLFGSVNTWRRSAPEFLV